MGFRKKSTTKKAPWTMVMQIANAHSFSIGFVGIQLTHGYVAALALSSASVVVGMILSLMGRFPTGNLQIPLAVASGLPLGAIVAFVFDSMTLFGLKMVHESSGLKKWFAFLLIGLGIALSTMAGDQMWNVIYNDWHGIVLAMSVSCVIIMMDVWHREHDAAVKRASTQPDAMQTALATEVEVVVDKKLRQYTHEQLNSPEMEMKLREQSVKSVQDIVQIKFNKRLAMFAGSDGVGQIKSIQEVKEQQALPEKIDRSEEQETVSEGEAVEQVEQVEQIELAEEQQPVVAVEPVEQNVEPVEQADEQVPSIASPEPARPRRKPTGRTRYYECRDELKQLLADKTAISDQMIADHFQIAKSTANTWRDRLKKEAEAVEEVEAVEQANEQVPSDGEQVEQIPEPVEQVVEQEEGQTEALLVVDEPVEHFPVLVLDPVLSES